MENFLIRHLSKHFSSSDQSPVDGITLEIAEGEFISIEGSSGSGKSTLLYLLSGMLTPSSGSIVYKDKELTKMTKEQLSAWRKANIGYIFQETILFSALTAKENLVFAQEAILSLEEDTAQKNADDYLNLMGLQKQANQLPHTLSIGQQRRLIIARGLICNPPIIFADEPTNDLDEEWADKVIAMLAEQASVGRIVIMVTHHQKYAKMAPKRFLLKDGKLKSIV